MVSEVSYLFEEQITSSNKLLLEYEKSLDDEFSKPDDEKNFVVIDNLINLYKLEADKITSLKINSYTYQYRIDVARITNAAYTKTESESAEPEKNSK